MSSAQSRLTKYNGEVKFKEVETHLTSDLMFNHGSSTAGPANSLVLLNGLFGGDPSATTGDAIPGIAQGLGSSNVVGSWLTPAYPDSMKCTLDYHTLIPDATFGYPAINVRQVTGFIKSTGNKVNATTATPGDWLAACYP